MNAKEKRIRNDEKLKIARRLSGWAGDQIYLANRERGGAYEEWRRDNAELLCDVAKRLREEVKREQDQP